MINVTPRLEHANLSNTQENSKSLKRRCQSHEIYYSDFGDGSFLDII